MKIRTKRILMFLVLLLGVIWNCLCLLHAMQRSCYSVSVILIGGYALAFLLVPLLFPALSKADEKSNCYSELTQKEKRSAGIMIGLIAAWLVTLIACVAYPI
ncbi:MAG: hypothetical protein VB071_13080 [Lawsonibacter sp.]|nr:hypothetical protein [Lawsonibacter sp.]